VKMRSSARKHSELVAVKYSSNTVVCAPELMVRDSSVGITTRYGLDGLRFESRWRRVYPHLPGQSVEPTQPPIQRVPGHSSRKTGRGVASITHLRLEPRFKEE
jgi:hypothetical protein